MLSRRFRKQQRGRRWLTALALVSVVSGTLLVGGAVLASTPAGLFELEGNATSTANGVAPDDWDRVCYEELVGSIGATAAATKCSTDDDTNGAVAVAWAEDVHGAVGPLGECTGTNCTIFTGGGSKDPIDINQWAWKDDAGGLPDKDNLLHSFAARYSIPSSSACPGRNPDGTANTNGGVKCEMLFFGNDRYDNSGDAHQAFWFFQNKIGLGTNAVGGGQGFTSSGGTEFHRNGDLLLISNFSNGGSVSTITVYTWDTACLKNDISAKTGPISGISCGDANLRFQASSAAANCDPVNPAITGFCGIVNPTTNTVAPWPYVDKTTTNTTTHLPNTYLQGEFYEGGVNLSFLGLGGECFASVASETRSSTSTTAVLKDFVLGDFGDCSSSVTTTPKTGAGGAIADDANSNGVPDLSIGSGSVTVRDQATVTVNGVSTWTGSVAFTLCKLALTPITSNCASGGVAIPFVAPATGAVSNASPTVNSQVTTLTSVGRYCWRAVFTSNVNGVPGAVDPAVGSTNTSECFEVLPVQPTLATQAGGPVAAGGTITDTATISNLATKPGTNGIPDEPSINATNGAGATGTINWTAFGPDNCTTALTVTPSSITINGNNTYGPVSATPTVIGLYTFVASYTTADVNNLSIGASACPDLTETETVRVTGTSSFVTAQEWKPNDKATLTGDANLNGTLTFALYNDATCGQNGGIVKYSKSVTVTNAASGSSFSTDNETFVVKAGDGSSWSWLVTYNDTTLTDPPNSCKEVTSITINNNFTAP